MAPLRYAAKFDPFLSLDCARVEGVGEGRDQILPSGNLACDSSPEAAPADRRRKRREWKAAAKAHGVNLRYMLINLLLL